MNISRRFRNMRFPENFYDDNKKNIEEMSMLRHIFEIDYSTDIGHWNPRNVVKEFNESGCDAFVRDNFPEHYETIYKNLRSHRLKQFYADLLDSNALSEIKFDFSYMARNFWQEFLDEYIPDDCKYHRWDNETVYNTYTDCKTMGIVYNRQEIRNVNRRLKWRYGTNVLDELCAEDVALLYTVYDSTQHDSSLLMEIFERVIEDGHDTITVFWYMQFIIKMYWWCGCSSNYTLFGREIDYRLLTKYIVFADRLVAEHKQHMLYQAQLMFRTLLRWDISEKDLIWLTELIVDERINKHYLGNYREMLNIFKYSKFCRRPKYNTCQSDDSSELFGIKVLCHSVKYLGRYPEKYEILDYLRGVYEEVFLVESAYDDDDDDY